MKFGIKSLTTGTVTSTADQTCTLTDAVNGLCRYRFMTGDLPDPGGDYLCDLELTDAAELRETYYRGLSALKPAPKLSLNPAR